MALMSTWRRLRRRFNVVISAGATGDARRRARVLGQFCATMISICLVGAGLNVLAGEVTNALALIATAVAFVGPIALVGRREPWWAGHLAVGLLMTTSIGLSCADGGVLNPNMAWVAVELVMAVLVVGSVAARAWVAIALGGLALATWHTDVNEHLRLSATGSYGLLFLTVWWLAKVFDDSRLEAIASVERERDQVITLSHLRDAFFTTSPDLLGIIGVDMRFVQVSPSWQPLLGHQVAVLLGAPITTLVHPEDLSPFLKGVKTLREVGSVRDLEVRLRTSAGAWRTISWAATLERDRTMAFAIGRDVTDARALMRELAQAQKLEAVGQLAAGVAHEINTPIQFVSDNVQFAREGFAQVVAWIREVEASLTPEKRNAFNQGTDLAYVCDELPRALEEATFGVRRVAELVKAMREFSHPDQPLREPADLNAAIERTAVLVRGQTKHVATLELKLGAVPPLLCHIGSLTQVLLNLIVNAAHAIEDRVAVDHSRPEQHAITVSTRVEGAEAVIEVTDSGCGIPDAIRDRIFEPFFTTKAMGRGTGQGLSLVRSVVVGKHGGRIAVDSTLGQGTTFRLYLPLGAEPLARAA
jgi:PAS domain S-box-containing protein